MPRALPRCMYQKHGAYYLVKNNKWTRLAGNLHDALIEYARLTTAPDSKGFDLLVTEVLTDLKKTVAPSTYETYAHCAKRAREAFAEFAPEQIRPYHIACFLDDNKSTPGAANHLLAFLRNVFKRAVRWGKIEFDPTRDIGGFHIPARDRYITADEYQRIHAVASPTLGCLMDMAYLTGQRLGDILKIQYADISEKGIFIRQQKTNARMLIALTPDLSAVIAQARTLHQSVKGLTLFHRRNGTPLSRSSITHLWRTACQKAGVENAHFHDLRAAAATDAKAQGLNSKTLLGHITESSHNRYLRAHEVPIATPNKSRTA